MPKQLTQQEFEQRVASCVGTLYTVISPYRGKRYPITLRCNKHNVEFQANAECFMRGPNDVRCSCPECSAEKKDERFSDSRTKVSCAYCGKEFMRANSKISNSKSGLYFCCREHKDLAQRIENGFVNIWPEHYSKITGKNYREKAFRAYEHCCAICGWDEDDDVLEVHHIDENREHNEESNLIILCPTCHRKLTSHKYKLINREQIVLC